MPKSTYLANAQLNANLGGVTLSLPSTVYVALYTVAPTASGGGTEVTGGGYSRIAVARNQTNFPAASGGSLTNGVDFEFLQSTADWGTVVAAAIIDASSGGNLLYFGNLTTQRTVAQDTVLVIRAGDVVLSES